MKTLAVLSLFSLCLVVPSVADEITFTSEEIDQWLYQFKTTYKDKKAGNPDGRKELGQMVLVDAARVSGRASQQAGTLRAEAVCLARTLGNQPANVLTPTRLAREARAVANRRGLKIRPVGRPYLVALFGEGAQEILHKKSTL